jgi:hypothetical protein
MSGVKSAMIHRSTVRTMGVGALVFCAVGSCLGRSYPEPYTFFKQYIGDDQIADIEHGEPSA